MDYEREKGAKQREVKLSKDKFTDHVVVVTGAAQGIGNCTAQLLAKQGATVILVDIQETKLKTAQSEINAAAYKVCNVTNEDEIKETLKWIVDKFSRIDALIHFAGIFPFHPLQDYPTDQYHKMINVNVDSTFFLVREVLPYMQAEGYGRIVLTSSGTVQRPVPGLTAYVASKAAVVGIARAAAAEAGPGITVNSVMPGLIKTEGTWANGVQPDGRHPFFESIIDKQVVKRCGLPEDIAHAACFLASAEASWITGQILDVGGGLTFH